MSKIFVIDTENFSDYSFLENYQLTKKDKIILFCSDNSAKISFDDFERLSNSKAQIIRKNIEVGESNALDFKLITYITLNLNKKNEFYIVSSDSGFKAYKRFIKKEKNIDIQIVNPVKTKIIKKEDLDKINEVLSKNKSKIEFLIENNKSLSEFHNSLSKEFGMIGQKIYTLKKELFEEYHHIISEKD